MSAKFIINSWRVTVNKNNPTSRFEPKSIDISICMDGQSCGDLSFFENKTEEEIGAYIANVICEKIREIEL